MSDLDRKEWLDAMTTAILMSINHRPQTISRGGHNTTSEVPTLAAHLFINY